MMDECKMSLNALLAKWLKRGLNVLATHYHFAHCNNSTPTIGTILHRYA
jgi:hypothetical protein